ncbi:MAG TPA: hypothetical protein VGS19_30605 [Streptosporangiaceae bacterium]|nr:hypothetical protein [Streptosporangiaceae bacterium]
MTTATLGQLIEKHGFDVLDHLDRDLEIPVHAGLQAQGDLFIIPADPNPASSQGDAVPPDGIAVIEANGGHEHRLFAGQPGTAFFIPAGTSGQDIGLLECTEPAYIAHPEHAYAGDRPRHLHTSQAARTSRRGTSRRRLARSCQFRYMIPGLTWCLPTGRMAFCCFKLSGMGRRGGGRLPAACWSA